MKEMYTANENRYDNGMKYERCGRSGVLLPKVSLGFWHNFGSVDPYERSREITHYAFDHGITHFDLANNYGPVYGSAEETMGRLMDDDFRPYRDELFISTKAGYDMWPGPYGNWGSRKYLMASLDQSLKRMHLDYVDLFYSHRFDPDTPMEETLQALVDIVRAGKALYIGISNWPLEPLRFATKYLKDRDVPLLIYQGKLTVPVLIDRRQDGFQPDGRQTAVAEHLQEQIKLCVIQKRHNEHFFADLHGRGSAAQGHQPAQRTERLTPGCLVYGQYADFQSCSSKSETHQAGRFHMNGQDQRS